MVSGVTRPVHLTLLGDYFFIKSFDGHVGSSCRFPCGYCCALARPSAKTIKLIPKYADYGTLQDGSRAARISRTFSEKAEVAALYADGPLTTRSDPLAVTVTLSIERRPLMLFAPEDIVPMPLHITLGVSPLVLTLGLEAFLFDAGAARAHKYALELTATLRLYVGVSSARYWGGTFEVGAYHKIGRLLAAVCDVLDRYLPSARAAAYRRACELWADFLPVLNRAAVFDAPQRCTFRRQAAEFVDLLQSSFEWLSITPKLHILACQSADWLDRFGSLGPFAEQGLEAWHGYCNKDATVFAVGFFLESCVRLVQRAAVCRGPGDVALNRGKRRASATPNERCAKRAGVLRTVGARVEAVLDTRQSAACAVTADTNAEKWANNVYLAAVCKITTYRASPRSALGPAAAAEAVDVVATAKNEALLHRAEDVCMEVLLEDWHNYLHSFLVCEFER